MKTVFDKVQSYMKYVIGIAAEVVAYQNWNDEFSRKMIKESFDAVAKETENDLTFWKEVFELPNEQKFKLGFRYWSEEEQKMLIPLWIIECLPKTFHIDVTCINGTICDIQNINKDVRFNCVAYMI